VRQKFEGKFGCDFRNGGFTEHDFLQKRSLGASSTRRARQRVVDEEMQGIFPIFAASVLNQRDDFTG
jgi:hypothetical protein